MWQLILCYIWKLLGFTIRNFHHKEKLFVSVWDNGCLLIIKKVGIQISKHSSSHGYVVIIIAWCQIIILYILNLCSAMCQVYINKIVRKVFVTYENCVYVRGSGAPYMWAAERQKGKMKRTCHPELRNGVRCWAGASKTVVLGNLSFSVSVLSYSSLSWSPFLAKMG